ncbi:MAG: TonB-dependent receptor [Bacteroidetes bacterium]|nr:TonB-dependent receptor [Bacteroidota bacterium]
MYNRLLITTFLCVLAQSAFGQYTLSGTILEEKSKYPIEYATVVINDNELWAVSNDKGFFQIKNVPRGSVRITVTCMGFAKKTFEFNVNANLTDLTWYLPEENLTLNGIVVTAQNKTNELAASYVVDRVSLDHLQMLKVPDVMSLLPGGQTNKVLSLAENTNHSMVLRADGFSERGNAAFGTVIEMDGVRLSNNASFGYSGLNAQSSLSRVESSGAETRSMSSSNIESVELVTGIPSVTYGDMTQGVVKITTRKGKSPYTVEMSTNPQTKSFSVRKGFGLGGNAGILNVSAERTKSINSLMSPYTSYDRNNLAITYDNTFNRSRRPLSFTLGFTGNIGGYNSASDPDNFTDTYIKAKNDNLEVHTRFDYLPNLSWITNLEVTAGITYSNNLSERKINRSSSASTSALHGKEEGYFVSQDYDQYPDAPILSIPPGYWYQIDFVDDKPMNISTSVKARLSKKWGNVRNNALLGSDFNTSGNKGKGIYYDDLRFAPSWRAFPFSQIPFMNTLAVFAEDKIDWSIGASNLQLMAGVRSDMTSIKGSDYGHVSSLSPRINAIFGFSKEQKGWIKIKSIRAGWGKAVKLPSLSMLYPEPRFGDTDTRVFGASVSGNENFVAYYMQPRTSVYNPDLKWQYNLKAEAGLDIDVKGTHVSIAIFQDQTYNSYETVFQYSPFSYTLTDERDLNNCLIPLENRMFTIDRSTGIVQVSDKTGQMAAMELSHSTRTKFVYDFKTVNGSPVLRRGVDWIVDFGKIPALSTSIRWDGRFYYYRAVNETISPYLFSSTATMADGAPFKYLSYMVGMTNSATNGSMKKQVNSNLTLVTHIPAIRFIVSLKIEASVYNLTQNLSEYRGKPYGFVLDNATAVFPSETLHDIYAGDQFIGAYPLYYVTLDDMNTKIPFAESLRNAKDNDPALYNELIKIVQGLRTNYSFTMNPNRLSFYATAHLNLTKEIGNFASISFNAKNFLNTMQLFNQGWNNRKTTLFGWGTIPLFYYGISLKLTL